MAEEEEVTLDVLMRTDIEEMQGRRFEEIVGKMREMRSQWERRGWKPKAKKAKVAESLEDLGL